MEVRSLLDTLAQTRQLSPTAWEALIAGADAADMAYAAQLAAAASRRRFGGAVYLRGIIEFTNRCKNDCLYCGIRRSNTSLHRYRLSLEAILSCCAAGYRADCRTFVLQGGEDGADDDAHLCATISAIKAAYPDCAVTLSVGERSASSYRALKAAGADRYLLRHETADPAHYARLHPAAMSFDNRMRCLADLREAGFQVGCGMMIGSPYQTVQTLARDMQFLSEFQPEMVGLGPFIPHCATPFAACPAGSVEQSLFFISLVRLLLPDVMLPATTALGALRTDGRIRGILAGANVVMPNLSPRDTRQDYFLYDGKPGVEDDPHTAVTRLRAALAAAGYTLQTARGDFASRK